MTTKTDQVSVKTATVEIRTLLIGGNKVTISVFKQIPYRVLDYYYASPAHVWGFVNHFWGGHLRWINALGPDGKHRTVESRHVLWQRNGELHRSIVPFDDPGLIGNNNQLFISV